MQPRDTSADAAAVQLEAYRRMGGSARLRIGFELTALSRKLLADGIRARHPHCTVYSEEDVRLAMVRAWRSPAIYRLAYPGHPELDP